MTMTDQPVSAAQPLEVVDGVPATSEIARRDTPATDHTGGALERAAQAALEEVGVQGRDEFLTLAATARILAMSGAAPKLVKGNPYIAFHLALVGRDLGISPSAALALIDVIDAGQGPQLSLSPQLLNGQIRKLGVGEILKKRSTNQECIVVAVGPGGIDQRCRFTWRDDVHAEACRCDILGEVEFTWEDAQMASLAGVNCQPGDHKKNNDGKCPCSSGYIKYPKRMMWWRASGFCADDYFPEASLGMYTAEALGAIVDEDGRAVDPANAALPDGYEPAALPPPETSDPDELWGLQMRIRALTDDGRAALRERWGNAEKLKGWAPWALDPAQLRLAGSLIAGVESQVRTATKGDWQPGPALEQAKVAIYSHLCGLLGLHASPDAPEPDPSPEHHEAAQEPNVDDAAPEAPQPPTDTPTAPSGPILGQADEPRIEDLGDVSVAEADDVIAQVGALDAKGVDKELTRLRMHSEGDIKDRRRRLSIGLLRERMQGIIPATEPGEAPPAP